MERQTTTSTGAVEFTYNWYQQFLDRVEDAGYQFRRFADPIEPGSVFLRHDVDLSPGDALTMAQLEADRGVTSTYCFLLTSALYNPLEADHREQIREIRSLGHDIALHFSTHEYWTADEQPGEETLKHHIDEERAILGRLATDDIDIVSFHAPPRWVLNRELDDILNTYAPAYFEEMSYVADSGQRWRSSPPDIHEFGPSAQVLTHPGLWGEHDSSFDQHIERGVSAACRHANAKAQREFVEGGS